MPSKKEVLNVWATSWRWCIGEIKKHFKIYGYYDEDICLFKDKVTAKVFHSNRRAKHLRITIEEIPKVKKKKEK